MALKAKFQVGSIHARRDYTGAERVFHPSDMPAKAREAREQVAASIKHKEIDGKPTWDFGTSAGPRKSRVSLAPWDDDGFDNRYYAKLQSDHLVQKAKAKVDAIRSKTFVPDSERNAINARWNVSSQVQHTKVGLLHYSHGQEMKESKESGLGLQSQQEGVPQAQTRALTAPTISPANNSTATRSLPDIHNPAAKLKREQKLPSTYTPPHRREQIKLEQMRQAKLADRERKTQEALSKGSAYVDPDASHTDTAVRDLTIGTRSSDLNYGGGSGEISAELAATYSDDALKQDLDRLREEKQRQGNTPAPKIATVDQLPERPILGQTKSGATVLLNRKGNREVIAYEHLGAWEHSKIEGCDVWSCCMNTKRESRGCSERTVARPDNWNDE